MTTPIEPFAVADLKLDPENPRLPTELHGLEESEILSFLFDRGALEELAQSFLDNGFFEHEPLIILKDADGDGRHVVLEGNRRLATLKILLRAEEAGDVSFSGLEATDDEVARLRVVPCFPIRAREDVHRFLGFRHIGGIKKWSSDAKARYLAAEVARAVSRGVAEPFKEVGRRVGSNAQGVRNPYMALRILQHASAEFGLSVQYVERERFGVWLRCMNSADIRTYIGLGSPKTYPEVESGLLRLDSGRTTRVIRDLTAPQGQRAVVSDSRHVTDYGRVLLNDRARQVLDKHGDLGLALQVVDREDLHRRISRLASGCKVILDELPFVKPTAADLSEAETLLSYARSIKGLIGAGLHSDDD
jgi:hypothetical protein